MERIPIISIYFDGACDNRSKLKVMGIGVAVFVDGFYREDLSYCEMIGASGTSNIAEWSALNKALEIAEKLLSNREFKTAADVVFRLYGDSQLVVYQFNGKWAVKQEHLKEFYEAAILKAKYTRLEKHLKGVYWIRREFNGQADILSKKAITDFLNN